MGKDKKLMIVVDDNDVAAGEEDREKCHAGAGLLHRRFLAMAFSPSGELLLTRRSVQKRLWPGFWDGSAAGHVPRGEDYVQASRRRLRGELGIIADDVEYGFKFRYRAAYRDIGSEREICAVTFVRGIRTDSVRPDSNRISEVRFVDLKKVIQDIRENGVSYTPWLILALEHMSERPLITPGECVASPV